jgi:hypothetical protein
VGIGITNPHSSAILEVASSTKGFLPPRLNSKQRDSIQSPEEGLMIYNTESSCLEWFNGSYWYNYCCDDLVSNGIANFPFEIYFNTETKVNKIDINTGGNTGTEADHNDFVFSYESLVNNTTEIASFSSGVLEGNNVFQLKKEEDPNQPSYQHRKSIYRTVNRDLIGYVGPIAIASLDYDFTPDYVGEFEIFLIAKVDSEATNIIEYGAFFSSSDGVNDNSLQLGLGSTSFNADFVSGIPCEKNYFRLFYKNGSSNRNICGNTLDNRVRVDDGKFHVFNIIQRNHSNGVNYILELHIDGKLVQKDETLTDPLKFEKLKLFSNRKGDKAVKSNISDILFFSTPLDSIKNEVLNQYMLCKYGE